VIGGDWLKEKNWLKMEELPELEPERTFRKTINHNKYQSISFSF